MRMANIGVYVNERQAQESWAGGCNVFSIFISEMLNHFGVRCRTIPDIRPEWLRNIDVVIVGSEEGNEQTMSRLWQYVEQGGIVISYGGIPSWASRLGCSPAGSSAPGYARLDERSAGHVPMRYLRANPWSAPGGMAAHSNGMGVRSSGTAACSNGMAALPVVEAAASGELHEGSPDGRPLGPALQSWRIGKGRIERWAVDIPATIVMLQQGSKPIREDGEPAPDGTANVRDGILKADDVMEMDWTLDRRATPTGAAYFAYAYADRWKEIGFAHLVSSAAKHGLSIPFLDYWPDGVRAVATVSHDSDFNQDEHAYAALALLEELNICSTWCMLVPGYSQAVYEQATAAGHELAFHFNALHLENREWSEAEFAAQLQYIRDRTRAAVVSNKNHYTRMQGWGELFRWCETHGIACDQTRGPSKKGNVGFLFGTCHPYFPIAWADEGNRMYDVLELGMLTQDLNVNEHTSDPSIIRPLLEEVGQVRGVAHFLFHQNHIYTKESVRNAFREFVREARAMGFAFWTSQQINRWVRAKRGIVIKEVDANGDIAAVGEQAVDGAVVWIPVSGERSAPATAGVERKFGVWCNRVVLSLREGEMSKWHAKV